MLSATTIANYAKRAAENVADSGILTGALHGFGMWMRLIMSEPDRPKHNASGCRV